MFVGGREVSMQGGTGRFGSGSQTQIVEQAPVHYLIPPAGRGGRKLPVIMVPGMGLTSYLYLATPDGRDGWAQLFARAGHPVYVFDEPNNAVAGFDVSAFNAGAADASARFMLWANEVVWRRWGIGSDVGVPFEDTRYPVENIRQLYASMTPVFQGPRRSSAPESDAPAPAGRQGGRRGGRFRQVAPRGNAQDTPPSRAAAGRVGMGGGRFGAGVKADALVTLLEQTGPAILIVHSASSGTGLEATRMRPDLVRAIVAVEIVGSPTDPEDVRKHFADKVFIGVFGDHVDVRSMSGRHEACETTAKLIRAAGGKAEVIWLPKLGVKGNTHLLMQDNNNDDIAQMLLERLPN